MLPIVDVYAFKLVTIVLYVVGQVDHIALARQLKFDVLIDKVSAGVRVPSI